MPRYVDVEPYENCRIVANKEDDGILVSDLTTADVVEVVRCKDCKHCRKMNTPNLRFFCARRNNYTEEVGGKEFCSRGERIDGKDGDEK